MVLLVHIAPESEARAIRRNGIAPTRWRPDPYGYPECDRVVWAFPVLPSYTLTLSWARELKRWGRASLAALTFRLPDGEPVFARHFSLEPRAMSAAEACGLILAAPDPRGYEVIVPRRILPKEIVRAQPLPRAIGWRYYPAARGQPMRLCDCPMCLPRGEVKARRYRNRVRQRMAGQGLTPTSSQR
jgi:hypothetical protein